MRVDGPPRPGCFTPGKETWYSLCRRLGGLQGRSGRLRKISPPPGFDPRTVQPVASRYTDWAIPAYILYSINTFFFVMKAECVYSTVQAECLNIIRVSFRHRIAFSCTLISLCVARHGVSCTIETQGHAKGSWKSSVVIADGIKLKAFHKGLGWSGAAWDLTWGNVRRL